MPDTTPTTVRTPTRLSRRHLLTAATSAALLPLMARATPKETQMTPKAFVYTEVAISVPFASAPWQDISNDIRAQPGFLNKTWLSGHGTQSLGGFYAFDSLDNARQFVTGYFPSEPRGFGVAHNTRLFDAQITEIASRDIGSVHYGGTPTRDPGAFVYTELQLSVPFDQAPWEARNQALRQLPGLQNEVWLSGVSTQTLGGFDAFDTMDQALDFEINLFPETAASLGAAFYTRVFDAAATAEASRYLNSPYYLAS